MASIDRRGWHIYSRLVCEHQQLNQCARPQWLRILVVWHPMLAELVSGSRFWKSVLWAFPALFGGKALLCATCQMAAFQSTWAERFRRFVGFLTGWSDGDAEAILLLDDDVHNLSQITLEQLNVEDV